MKYYKNFPQVEPFIIIPDLNPLMNLTPTVTLDLVSLSLFPSFPWLNPSPHP